MRAFDYFGGASWNGLCCLGILVGGQEVSEYHTPRGERGRRQLNYPQSMQLYGWEFWHHSREEDSARRRPRLYLNYMGLYS